MGGTDCTKRHARTHGNDTRVSETAWKLRQHRPSPMEPSPLTRYTMRTRHVKDGKIMRARCTTHATCIAAGLMVQPSGRCVHLRCKTGNVKDLNWNLRKHLRKWDEVLGTNDEIAWDAGKIHGPEAPFLIPYNAVPCRSGDLGDTAERRENAV